MASVSSLHMAVVQSALSGLGKFMPVTRTDLQIIRLDLVGVTRPEAVNEVGSAGFRGAVPQAMMSKAFAADMASPVEGDEKTVSATVTMKIRF
jgi:hypothetical protein